LIFGKDRDKGIRLNGTDPEIVSLDEGVSEDDLLFHDERAPEPSLAYLLSRMAYPEFPEPMGVLRCVDAPVYEDQVYEQINSSVKSKGEGDLNKLFHSADTWTVS